MIIEDGDYLAVNRGFEYMRSTPMMFGMFTDPGATDSSPQYDRHHEGRIYLALSVEDSLVSARCVHDPYKRDKGCVEIINLREVEVTTLGKKFVESVVRGDA